MGTFDSGSITMTGAIASLPTGIPSGTNPTATPIYGTTNGANQTAYTVPAGHTLYVYGLGICNASVTTALKSNADAVLFYVTTPAGITTASITSNAPLAVYTAGQNVRINGTNASNYVISAVEVTN
jgi:hypothetical protein